MLVDRGHRELPIQADYVGKKVPTADDDVVKVAFEDDRRHARQVTSSCERLQGRLE